MDESALSEWEHDGASSYRMRRDPYGNKIMAIVVSNAAGWSVEHPNGGESPRGSECGKAGRAAADRAALELGWALEGGPTPPPSDVSALQAELAEAKRLAEFWTSEGDRLIAERDEALRNLRHAQSEREKALERAIVAMALRMGER